MENQSKVQQLEVYFKKNKAVEIESLSKLLNCSQRTIHRKLKLLRSISSFNMNGRYYTLPGIAKFDNRGLWSYNKIGFSKHGGLKQTIEVFINSSLQGLSANELEDILQSPLHPVLTRMEREESIKREKFSGRYVYFSSDPKTHQGQLKQLDDYCSLKQAMGIPCELSVKILVKRIEHPTMTIDEFVKVLRTNGILVGPHQVKAFFKFHGIEKKTASS